MADTKTVLSSTAQGASVGSAFGPWGAVIGGGVGLLSGLFGGKGGKKKLKGLGAAFEADQIQGFLPPSLRLNQTGGFLQSGVQQIGQLIQRPGSLSPTVSEAILPRLAEESESIATNFRGIGSQQAGAAARGNLPVSIKTALDSALNVAQERAQRGARRGALMDSDQLRRQDLSQTYSVLDAILGFLQSGRGQATQALSAAANLQQNDNATMLAGLGSLLQGVGSFGAGGGGGGGGSTAFGPMGGVNLGGGTVAF